LKERTLGIRRNIKIFPIRHFAVKINFSVRVKTFQRFWRLKIIFRHNKGGVGCSSLWRCSPTIPYRSRVRVGAAIHTTTRQPSPPAIPKSRKLRIWIPHTLYFNTCWSNNEASETWSCLGILR
jgi:hypothetical protein